MQGTKEIVKKDGLHVEKGVKRNREGYGTINTGGLETKTFIWGERRWKEKRGTRIFGELGRRERVGGRLNRGRRTGRGKKKKGETLKAYDKKNAGKKIPRAYASAKSGEKKPKAGSIENSLSGETVKAWCYNGGPKD